MLERRLVAAQQQRVDGGEEDALEERGALLVRRLSVASKTRARAMVWFGSDVRDTCVQQFTKNSQAAPAASDSSLSALQKLQKCQRLSLHRMHVDVPLLQREESLPVPGQ